MAFIELILLISVLTICFYKWLTYHKDFFKVRGIPYAAPHPLLGSFGSVLLKKDSLYDAIVKKCNEFRDKQVFGIFEGRFPLIVIKDADLIKRIFVKDFDHFINHRVFIEPEDEPLFGNSMLLLTNQKWKDMRSTLSPAFTGSKMRLMFKLVTDCCEEANKVLMSKLKKDPKGFTVDMKDFASRITNDVIASSAFGLKIDSVLGANSEFYEMGKTVTTQDGIANLKFFLITNFRKLMRALRVKVFDPKSIDYFLRLVLDTMKYRIEHNVHRPDMIDMLIEARTSKDKSHNREWTDEEIAAQCFIFFFAGFESISATICFAAHELMANPECQDKLYEEIKEINENLNGKPLTYETLSDLKYMEMVITETLRKWPPFVQTDRVCTKPYKLETDDQVIDFNVGDVAWIPIVGLHNDPKYFPNPKQFDPERFSDENKGNFHPFAYCPFGAGPRNCIGSRMAIMEAKAMLFYILKDFKLEKSEKTQIPIELESASFQVRPKAGFWLKYVPRN